MKRRTLLKASSLLASGAFACPAILRAAAPNSKLQVACIGVGGKGASDLQSVASHDQVQVTALCDVDDRSLDAASKKFPDASRHKDWRDLLSDHAERFDALIVATPDHMHAAPAVTALRANKHLYLEKPMASTLLECRVITQEAAKAGVVTQLGNQGRSSVESRLTVELLRSGVIGKIKEVVLWENKPLSWWPKNTQLRSNGDPIPSALDWDLWLGVRPERPYLENTYHPKTWRAWFDFGVGEMGDMGCHHFDTTFDALHLTAPLKVRQRTPGSKGPLWGKKRIVEMIFPGTSMTADDTVRLTWYDGGIEPQGHEIMLPSAVDSLPVSGTYWIGQHGAIFKNYRGGRPVVLPEDLLPEDRYPADPPRRSHYHDWVDAIIEGHNASGHFAHGGPLSEAVLVGAMADRFAKEWLHWQVDELRFADHVDANSLIRRQYRSGWQVQGLG